jgi:hypothetical protein
MPRLSPLPRQAPAAMTSCRSEDQDSDAVMRKTSQIKNRRAVFYYESTKTITAKPRVIVHLPPRDLFPAAREHPMAPSNTEKEKKSRWRSMLGGGHDTKADDTSHLRPGPSPKDSAYGGSERTTSEQASTRPQSAEPSETKIKKDPSTGNIVTTTVTTTTTTTTVTTGSGEHIKTESTPTVEADATARIRDSDEPRGSPAAANARPINQHENEVTPPPRLDSRYNAAPGTTNPAARVTNPAELDAPITGTSSGEENGPPIPAKSNKRLSREMNYQPPRPISEGIEPPVSPVNNSPSQHNFSYPARSSPHIGQQSSPGQQPSPGQRYYQDQRPHQTQGAHHDQQPEQGQRQYQPYPGQQAQQNHQPYPNQQPHPGLTQASQNQTPHQGQQIMPNSTSQQAQRPGTFQNLKVAAAGIHVSETMPSSSGSLELC